MRFAPVLAVALLAACHKDSGSPSCHDRVATMAAQLAANGADQKGKPNDDPATVAQALVTATSNCPEAAQVFAGVAAIDGDKRTYLVAKVPPAIEACQCKASPEEVGGLVERLFDLWPR